MKFEIYQGEKIQVTSDQFSLRGELQNNLRYHVKLYRNQELILEWKLSAVLWSHNITIVQQNLPLEIIDCRHRSILKFTLDYGDNTILIKFNPLRKEPYTVYLNDQKAAFGYFPKKVTPGYRQFALETSSEDETQNLYMVLAFLLRLIPVL